MTILFIEKADPRQIVYRIITPFFEAHLPFCSYDVLRNICLSHDVLPEGFSDSISGFLIDNQAQDKEKIQNALTSAAVETQIRKDEIEALEDAEFERKDKGEEKVLQEELSPLITELVSERESLQRAKHHQDTLANELRMATYMGLSQSMDTVYREQQLRETASEIEQHRKRVKVCENQKCGIQNQLNTIKENRKKRAQRASERQSRYKFDGSIELSYEAQIKLNKKLQSEEVRVDDSYNALAEKVKSNFWHVFYERLSFALPTEVVKEDKSDALRNIMRVMGRFHQHQESIKTLMDEHQKKSTELEDNTQVIQRRELLGNELLRQLKTHRDTISTLSAKRDKIGRWHTPTLAIATVSTLTTGFLAMASFYPNWVTAMGAASVLCTPPVLWGFLALTAVSAMIPTVLACLNYLTNYDISQNKKEANNIQHRLIPENNWAKIDADTQVTRLGERLQVLDTEIEKHNADSITLFNEARQIEPARTSLVSGFASNDSLESLSSPRRDGYSPRFHQPQPYIDPQASSDSVAPSAPPLDNSFHGY